MTRPVPIIAGTLVALLLLLGTYMGSYYAMLKGKRYSQYDDGQGYVYKTRPLYHIERPPPIDGPQPTSTVALLLSPAHQLDRLIRPRYWAESRPTGLFTD
jgi:hypothetical protein